MKRGLLDILACPIDHYYPLDLYEFVSTKDVIEQGVLVCSRCSRYYPIIDEIPMMLPDEMRKEKEDLEFLKKWRDKIPEQIFKTGKPFHA